MWHVSVRRCAFLAVGGVGLAAFPACDTGGDVHGQPDAGCKSCECSPCPTPPDAAIADPAGDGGDIAPDFAWLVHVGTTETDHGDAIAVSPDGDIAVVGLTLGAVQEATQLGYGDVFLARLSGVDGGVLWQVQLGSPQADQPLDVAFDPSGNILIAGYTEGTADEMVDTAEADGFVAKVDGQNGELIWWSQPGTEQFDAIDSLAIDDAGNVLVAGHTEGALGGIAQGNGDVVLGKLDGSDGTPLWWAQYGSSEFDTAYDIAVDAAGDFFVVGYSSGDFEGIASRGAEDAFVTKHSGDDGAMIWSSTIGTDATDMARAVAVDSEGDIYVAGDTEGAVGGANAGALDVFVSKRGGQDGQSLWLRQLGTPTIDVAVSLYWTEEALLFSADSYGPLGPRHIKARDVVVLWLNASGDVERSVQLGTEAHDYGGGSVMDRAGRAYVVGTTGAELVPDTALGSFDAFVAKLP